MVVILHGARVLELWAFLTAIRSSAFCSAISLASGPLCPVPSPPVWVKWSGFSSITSAMLFELTSGMNAWEHAIAISKSLSSSHKQMAWDGRSKCFRSFTSSGRNFSARYWQLTKAQKYKMRMGKLWQGNWLHRSNRFLRSFDELCECCLLTSSSCHYSRDNNQCKIGWR